MTGAHLDSVHAPSRSSSPRSALGLAFGFTLGALLAAAPVASAGAAPLLQQQPDSAQAAAAAQQKGESGEKKKKKAKKDKQAAPAGAEVASGERTPKRTGPLFESDTPLQLKLTADYGDIFKARDTLRPRVRPGRLTVLPADTGAPRTIPVSVSTRGHFRLRPGICPFAPLRVVFDSGGRKDTPFENQRALKLATHCRNGSKEFEQNVLREYLAYRVYNLLTDKSFRVRLARISYAEARDTNKVVTSWGFFVESERELARRLGGRLLEARGGKFEDFDPEQADLLAIFQYMIGNTDFSIYALHNIRVFATTQAYVPVAYDFDWSGVVNARYAVPDPRLGTRTVLERLYRGPCRTPEELAPTLAKFVAARDSINALYRNMPDLDRGYVREVLEYYDDFYKVIGDARSWRNVVRQSCQEAQ